MPQAHVVILQLHVTTRESAAQNCECDEVLGHHRTVLKIPAQIRRNYTLTNCVRLRKAEDNERGLKPCPTGGHVAHGNLYHKGSI